MKTYTAPLLVTLKVPDDWDGDPLEVTFDKLLRILNVRKTKINDVEVSFKKPEEV
jgi:hypothetical protein